MSITVALKRALLALREERPTLAATNLYGLAHHADALERIEQLMVEPQPADQGDRVVIGEAEYDRATPPKRYPPLTVALKGGVVRGLGIGLGRYKPRTKSTQKLVYRLIRFVDAALEATERRTKRGCPTHETRHPWDDEIEMVEITLSDLEMAMFKDLFHEAFTARRISRTETQVAAPYLDELNEIACAITDHYIRHGGYDHGTHIDNIFSLNPQSPLLHHYGRTGETL